MGKQAHARKRGAVVLAEQFQEAEALYPYYRLIEAGVETKFAGLGAEEYVGKRGYPLAPHVHVRELSADSLDVLVIPGGWAPEKLRNSPEVLSLVREMDARKKIIAAICHAGWVIASAGIIKGRRVTCYSGIKDDVKNAGGKYVDEPVVVDGNLITSRKPDDLPEFMKAVIEALSK